MPVKDSDDPRDPRNPGTPSHVKPPRLGKPSGPRQGRPEHQQDTGPSGGAQFYKGISRLHSDDHGPPGQAGHGPPQDADVSLPHSDGALDDDVAGERIRATLMEWQDHIPPTLKRLAKTQSRARHGGIEAWIQDLLGELWVEAYKRKRDLYLQDTLPADESADLGADVTNPPLKQVNAWLLEVATDICRRRQRQVRRDAGRLTPLLDGSYIEGFIAGARAIAQDDQTAKVEFWQAFEWLLGLIHPQDAYVLRLYVQHDGNYALIAPALKLKQMGAARARKCRALKHLAKAVATWQAQHPDQELPWPFPHTQTPPTEEEGR